jgi:hypothetical protein
VNTLQLLINCVNDTGLKGEHKVRPYQPTLRGEHAPTADKQCKRYRVKR